MTFRTALITTLVAASVLAGTPTGPVGRWKTYDDKTGALHGLVEITEENGVLKGRILKSYDPLKPNPTCDLCEGERKGQPVLGMVFLWGLTRQGEEFQGGYILDPDNGKVYRAKVRVDEGGRKLLVRGFIGISLLGRTQTWVREEGAP
ncbi:MAG: DUF2147 domain-containing protein [Geothrix sp.]|nr:DUF2147 domain-containing protein [Geothrix sp.]